MTSYVLSKSSTHEAVQHIVCKGDLFLALAFMVLSVLGSLWK